MNTIIDMEHFLARSGPMAEYAAELLQLQETCAFHLATFSPRLRQVGEGWLRVYAKSWQCVEWIWPLALGTAWSVPQIQRKTMAVANALTTIHAHIQRLAMDDHSGRSGDLLPFGSLLYTQVVRRYQQLFPLASGFWTLLEGHYLEWAETILWERERQRGVARVYSQGDVLRLAGSRALLKIGSLAVAMLGGRQKLLMPLSGALDQIHVAIQLIDGVVNWQEDFRARRATCFLTEAALALDAREIAALEQADLVEFLAASSLPGKVIRRALGHLSMAKKLAGRLDAPAFVACLDDFGRGCKEIPRRLRCDLGALSGAPATASLPI